MFTPTRENIRFTSLQVLTGCIPFGITYSNAAIISKVVNGGRPRRPPGFNDSLWDLLAETWLDQHFDEPQKRPPISTVLDRLRESVDDWGKSIIPQILHWEETSEYPMSPSKCRDSLMSLLRKQTLRETILQTQSLKEKIIFQGLLVGDHHI